MSQLPMIRPVPAAPDDRAAPEPRRRPLSLVVYPGASEEGLIRRLALDRLRDLHDDGVTLDYIGRMYDTSGKAVQSLEKSLRRYSVR